MSFKFSLGFLVVAECHFLKRYGYHIPPHLDDAAIREAGDNEAELMQIYEQLCQLPPPATPYFSSSHYASILEQALNPP